MDYRKEKENLVDKVEYLKLKEGSHNVVFIDDGKEVMRTFPNDAGVDEETKRMQFNVEVNAEPYLWEMSKTTAKNSLYGQLIVVGAIMNTLIGKKVNVLVQGTGKAKRYIVPEALAQETGITEETVV